MNCRRVQNLACYSKARLSLLGFLGQTIFCQEASKELQDCLLGNESKRKAVTEEPARHKRMNRGGLKPPASPEEESQEEAEEDAESKPKTRGSGRHAKDGEDGDDDDDEDDDDEDADLFAGPFNCQTPAKSKGLGLLDNLTPKQQKLAESFEPGLRKTFPEEFSRLLISVVSIHRTNPSPAPPTLHFNPQA